MPANLFVEVRENEKALIALGERRVQVDKAVGELEQPFYEFLEINGMKD